jgi:Domain of unknown function (DUF6429)
MLKSNSLPLNIDRIGDVILSILHLGLHQGSRAWQTFDWDAMARLYEKGFITDPVDKAKT